MPAESSIVRPSSFPPALLGGVVGALIVLVMQLVWSGAVAASVSPLTGVVQTEGLVMGRVHYAQPFEHPPALALENHERFVVLTQDAFGFDWADKSALDKVPIELRAAAGLQGNAGDAASSVPGAAPARFTWTARGIAASGGGVRNESGQFRSVINETGQVGFSRAFQSPPRVELNLAGKSTIITEVTPTYFRWKNCGDSKTFDNKNISWTAYGTPEAD